MTEAVQSGLRICCFVRFLTRLENTSPSVQCVRRPLENEANKRFGVFERVDKKHD